MPPPTSPCRGGAWSGAHGPTPAASPHESPGQEEGGRIRWVLVWPPSPLPGSSWAGGSRGSGGWWPEPPLPSPPPDRTWTGWPDPLSLLPCEQKPNTSENITFLRTTYVVGNYSFVCCQCECYIGTHLLATSHCCCWYALLLPSFQWQTC